MLPNPVGAALVGCLSTDASAVPHQARPETPLTAVSRPVRRLHSKLSPDGDLQREPCGGGPGGAGTGAGWSRKRARCRACFMDGVGCDAKQSGRHLGNGVTQW